MFWFRQELTTYCGSGFVDHNTARFLITGKQTKTVVPADIKAKLNLFNFNFNSVGNQAVLPA